MHMLSETHPNIDVDTGLPLMWNLAPFVLRNQDHRNVLYEDSDSPKMRYRELSMIRAGYKHAHNKKEYLKEISRYDTELQKILPVKLNFSGLEQILGVLKVRPESDSLTERWYHEKTFIPATEIKAADWELVIASNNIAEGDYMRYGRYDNWMQAKNTDIIKARFWISPNLKDGKNLEFNFSDMIGYFSYEGINESLMVKFPMHYYANTGLGAGISGLRNNYTEMHAIKAPYKKQSMSFKYSSDSSKKNPLVIEGGDLDSISKSEMDRIIGTSSDKVELTKDNIIMGRIFSQYSLENSQLDFDAFFRVLFNIYQNKEFDKLKGLDFVPFKKPYKATDYSTVNFISSLDGHGPEHYPYSMGLDGRDPEHF